MALKILGGIHRSRLLKTPAGQETRPTRAMVREAVFNILQGDCPDARVLDLFAGSGAMGLEALSRGARSAVFCDSERAAIAAIKFNAQSLGLEQQSAILHMDWARALSRLGGEGEQFDLIFLDPPYKMEIEPVLKALEHGNILGREGMMILEQSSASPFAPGERFQILKSRRYGETSLYLLTLSERAQ